LLCGKRWLVADALPVMVGTWSARVIPSTACACRMRVAAMRRS
jgi:hypothetical protein